MYDAWVWKHLLALDFIVLLLLGVGCKTADRGVVRNESSSDVYVSSVPDVVAPGCQKVEGLGRAMARNSSLRLPPGRIADVDLESVESSTNISWGNCVAASLDGLEDWKIARVGDLVLIVDTTERGELLLFESPLVREEKVLNWPLLFAIGGGGALAASQAYRVRKRRMKAAAEAQEASAGDG